MRDAADGRALLPSDDRSGSHRSIVSNLVALIGHVQASMKLIDAAIAMESARGNQDANIIVLDDVTPRYAKANAALNAGNAGLGVALHFLMDRAQGHATDGEPGHEPVRLIGRV